MSSTVTLSPGIFDCVVREAQKARQTPDALVEGILQQAFHTVPDRWRDELDALIRRVHSRTGQFDPCEIEADITAAAEEVKEMRRARQGRH